MIGVRYQPWSEARCLPVDNAIESEVRSRPACGSGYKIRSGFLHDVDDGHPTRDRTPRPSRRRSQARAIVNICSIDGATSSTGHRELPASDGGSDHRLEALTLISRVDELSKTAKVCGSRPTPGAHRGDDTEFTRQLAKRFEAKWKWRRAR